jgi:5-methylcytosine-specific restriction endonuclease McrA
MEEEDLFKSEEWQKATPERRRAFLSKIRANARIEKDIKKKEERKAKIAAKVPPVVEKKAPAVSQPAQKKLTKRQKHRAKLAERRAKGLMPKKSKALSTKPAPQQVAGIDVTTTEFLSTYEWRKTRMVALKKYGARCQCCGSTPATGAVIHVDHIKPRKLFPHLALDVDNLQVLCHECNHGKGNWDQTDWRNI